MVLSDCSFSYWLHQRAETCGDRAWITDVEGTPASYSDVDARATRIAGALARKGCTRGTRVLMLAGNSSDFIAVLMGILRAGCVVVPVNVALSGAMLTHVCRDADAQFLFADEQGRGRFEVIASAVPRVDEIIVIGSDGIGPGTLAAFERTGIDDPLGEEEQEPGDIAAILYTSGTTGPAKGVMLPNAHLFQNASLYIREMRLDASDTIYCTLPLFHLNGLTLQLFASLIVGCPFFFRRHFSASAWIDDVRLSGATVTNLLGNMNEFVLSQPRRADDSENRLRHIVAVPTQKGIRERFESRFGVRLVELYGMTEITCPLYMPLDGSGPSGSCGRLLSDSFEAAIVDPATDLPVPPGSAGELVVRPLHPFGFMAGYFNRSDATVAAWRNLWFHTGDVLRADDDGYFYFIDRLKDCVRRRGENVSTFEVEQALMQMDGIDEVAVFGVASPFAEGEQEIKAVVVARADIEPLAIFDHAAANLPHFAVPRVIELADCLPRTGTGKVEKAKLRELGISPDCWIAPDIDRPRTGR